MFIAALAALIGTPANATTTAVATACTLPADIGQTRACQCLNDGMAIWFDTLTPMDPVNAKQRDATGTCFDIDWAIDSVDPVFSGVRSRLVTWLEARIARDASGYTIVRNYPANGGLPQVTMSAESFPDDLPDLPVLPIEPIPIGADLDLLGAGGQYLGTIANAPGSLRAAEWGDLNNDGQPELMLMFSATQAWILPAPVVGTYDLADFYGPNQYP